MGLISGIHSPMSLGHRAVDASDGVKAGLGCVTLEIGRAAALKASFASLRSKDQLFISLRTSRDVGCDNEVSGR